MKLLTNVCKLERMFYCCFHDMRSPWLGNEQIILPPGVTVRIYGDVHLLSEDCRWRPVGAPWVTVPEWTDYDVVFFGGPDGCQ